MKIVVDYVTKFPLLAQSPKVVVIENVVNEYEVLFIDNDSNELISTSKVLSNQCAFGTRQWFTNWKIQVKQNNQIIYEDNFTPKGEVIFIKIDAHALGDNLAWMPYIEEFRKKHDCKVICSTFFNDLFQYVYKDILFVQPNTHVVNVYAQYYIGTFDPLPTCYAPSNTSKKPLQQVASDILGLTHKEIRPLITLPTPNKQKTVCISERASSSVKEWKGNWQEVVDFLVSEGYKVIVISKEPTKLVNVIDKTGPLPLQDRIQDLVNCEFFIGVSSGLSWLAWACGVHTFLISDFTPPNHEFKENCTRIYSENCVNTIESVENIDSKISSDDVILNIKDYFLLIN